VGPAADVYALGALLRHCAAGPLSGDLAALVDAALARDPSARPSAGEVHRRLLALLDGEAWSGPALPAGRAEAAPTVVAANGVPVAPTMVTPPPEMAPTGQRSPGRAAPLIATAVLVVVLGLSAMLHHRGSGANPGGAVSTPPSTSTVPSAADPAQVAHNLADWLRSQSK
jgi:hypothetical protein